MVPDRDPGVTDRRVAHLTSLDEARARRSGGGGRTGPPSLLGEFRGRAEAKRHLADLLECPGTEPANLPEALRSEADWLDQIADLIEGETGDGA